MESLKEQIERDIETVEKHVKGRQGKVVGDDAGLGRELRRMVSFLNGDRKFSYDTGRLEGALDALLQQMPSRSTELLMNSLVRLRGYVRLELGAFIEDGEYLRRLCVKTLDDYNNKRKGSNG